MRILAIGVLALGVGLALLALAVQDLRDTMRHALETESACIRGRS